MKKSSQVTLGLVASMALAFTGCSRRGAERRDCVDEQNHIVGEQNCANAEDRRSHGYVGYLPYRWTYGGRTGGRIGDTVFEGNPRPGMGVSAGRGGSTFGSPSGTTRGGFGGFFGGGS